MPQRTGVGKEAMQPMNKATKIEKPRGGVIYTTGSCWEYGPGALPACIDIFARAYFGDFLSQVGVLSLDTLSQAAGHPAQSLERPIYYWQERIC